MDEPSYDPASHYDRVTQAWAFLLGEDLHYGVFATGDEPLPVATAALTEQMVVAAQIEPGVRVLDVGCGTGGPARHLAGLGAEVTGITTSAVGVASATELTEAAGLGDRASFEVRDGTDNGLPDASFDRAWVLESSHLMPARERLVAECARVVRPGGRVALCDIMLRRPMPFEEVRRLRVPLAVLREVFGNARMEQRETYEGHFAAAGLEVDTSLDLTGATRPTFDRWRANARDHRNEVLAALGEDDLARFVEACDILEGMWDDGTMGYGLVAGHRP